ncbi:MAG: hypothetical protein KC933_24485 [Myxococcales bacterium]|nr:hypothetical protein [Myxococcales bacterium]
MDAVSACRGLAAEVWQGQRDRALWEADGLNAEDVVRHRLRGVVQDILRESGLRREAYAVLAGMDVVRDAAVDVLAASEAAVRAQLPRGYACPQAVLHGAGKLTFHLVRLVVLQELAGRLGVWAVSPDAVEDARVARRLVRGPQVPGWGHFRGLLKRAKLAYEADALAEAAVLYLDVDRMVRTAAGLLRAAIALGRSGDRAGARWAVRACLLEPVHRFEGPAAYQQALALERRLVLPSPEPTVPGAPPARSVPRTPSTCFEAVLLTPPAIALASPRAPTPQVSLPEAPPRRPTELTDLFVATDRIELAPVPEEDIFAFHPLPTDRTAAAPLAHHAVQDRMRRGHRRPPPRRVRVVSRRVPLWPPPRDEVTAWPTSTGIEAALSEVMVGPGRAGDAARAAEVLATTREQVRLPEVTLNVLTREILKAERLVEAPVPWIEALSQTIYEACRASTPTPRAASESATEPWGFPTLLERVRVYALPGLPVATLAMAEPLYPDPAEAPRWAPARSQTPRPCRPSPALPAWLTEPTGITERGHETLKVRARRAALLPADPY